MTLKNALNLAQALLDEKTQNYAIFILCEYLQRDRSWLFLNANLDFDEKPYFDLVKRFARGEAFEYIFEKASFYGLDFKVQSGVLIPRFDTEILLELCLKEFAKNSYKNILEIGCGSGILSIIIALKTGQKITTCDISEKALNLAKENAKAHKVEHLIEFVLSDFRNLKGEFDLIFSNPPYIKNSYPLDIWVQKEPKEALFGGEQGFEFLQDLIEFSAFKGVKSLLCEFGFDQRQILGQILQKNGFEASFYKDYQGFDRAFVARNLSLR